MSFFVANKSLENIILIWDITSAEHSMGISETVKELHITLTEVFGCTDILNNILCQHGGCGAQQTTARAIGSLVFLLIHSLSSCWSFLGESLISSPIHAEVETLNIGKEKNGEDEKASEAQNYVGSNFV